MTQPIPRLEPFATPTSSNLAHWTALTSSNSLDPLASITTDQLLALQEQLKARQNALHDATTRAEQNKELSKHWLYQPTASLPAPVLASGSRSATPVPSTSAVTLDGPVASTSKLAAPATAASSPEPSDADSLKLHRKKKKRKHDLVLDSDNDYSESETAEPPLNKIRKLEQQSSIMDAQPLPPHTRPALDRKDSLPKQSMASRQGSPTAPSPAAAAPTGLSLRLKLSGGPPKPNPYVKRAPPPPGVADDFSMPPRSHVPLRPHTAPPEPLPKDQSQVNGDYDQIKQGNQTPYATFLTSIEPYLRSFGEDDLAYLGLKSDDISPFLIPALGRPYVEQWHDEDNGLGLFGTTRNSPPPATSNPLEPPPLSRFRPNDLTEEQLVTENVHLGPLTERLVASLNDGGLASLLVEVPTDEVDASAGTAAPMDAIELEDRLKRELRFLGVFPTDALVPSSALLAAQANTGDIDWSLRTDDEISTALRACQRALRDQIDVNEGKKAKLATIVKDRMAYQEFESTRDGIEKVIETGWIKRQRYGKKKAPVVPTKPGAKPPPVPVAPPPAIVINEPKPPLSRDLLVQMDRRKRFIGAFQPLFDGQPEGRFAGLPGESVYGEEDKEA